MFFLIRVNQRCQNIQLIAISSILPGRHERLNSFQSTLVVAGITDRSNSHSNMLRIDTIILCVRPNESDVQNPIGPRHSPTNYRCALLMRILYAYYVPYHRPFNIGNLLG